MYSAKKTALGAAKQMPAGSQEVFQSFAQGSAGSEHQD